MARDLQRRCSGQYSRSRSSHQRDRPAQESNRLARPPPHEMRDPVNTVHHLPVLFCAVLGKLTVKSWVSLPLLFLGSATGVAALIDLLLSQRDLTLESELSLSAPLLFGFAAGLALFSADQVQWRFRWQRRSLRFAYPLTMVICAIALDALTLPTSAALIIGPVAAVLLAALLMRTTANRDEADCLTP